jgi:methionine-rich copper-binding protein CopC
MVQCWHSAGQVLPALNVLHRSALLLVLVVISWLVAATSVYAHARLNHSTPAAGSEVKTAPQAVSIVFTQNVEPAFSAIIVTDQTGQRVDKNDTARIGTDRKALRVSLPPLKPGRYQVQWRVLSVDGHKTGGEFTFSVAK